MWVHLGGSGNPRQSTSLGLVGCKSQLSSRANLGPLITNLAARGG